VNRFTKSSHWNKVALATLALSLAVGPSLRGETATTKPVELPKLPPEAVEKAPDPVLATVDGIPIDRDKFTSLLMAIGGPRLFEQVVTFVLSQEACDKAGIQIKPEDIEAEKTKILNNLAVQYPDVKAADRERLLAVILQKQGITIPEFQLSLQRAACLRALAKGKAQPTDDDVQKAWDIDNADKVQLLDIIVPDHTAAAELRKVVDVEKKSPLELAQKKGYKGQEITLSKAAPQTGDGKTLSDVAFQTKEGDLSAAIGLGGKDGKPLELHVLYCVKTIPATNKTMSAADRTSLKDRMTEAYESRWSEAHLRKLMAEAHIDIKDKTLSTYYQMVNAQNRAAASQPAATEPAK
jgi:hypothetical protein